MKKIIACAGVLLFFIVLSVYLFTTGKGHTVYVMNTEIEGVTPIKEMVVTVDNSPKIIKLKKGKKAAFIAKGSNHEFVISYKVDSEEKKVTGEFKTLSGKEAFIDLSKFINGDKEWLSHQDIVIEAPEPEEPAPAATTTEVKTTP